VPRTFTITITVDEDDEDNACKAARKTFINSTMIHSLGEDWKSWRKLLRGTVRTENLTVHV
jgi:hypothetical protein